MLKERIDGSKNGRLLINVEADGFGWVHYTVLSTMCF